MIIVNTFIYADMGTKLSSFVKSVHKYSFLAFSKFENVFTT